MAALAIPLDPALLTPDWLTDALRAGGAVGRARVASVDTEADFAAGAGFIGNLSRLRLQYDVPEPGAPTTLIAKIPSAAPEARLLADAFRLFEREVRFYQQIAPTVEMRTPRCYYSDFDPETRDFVLLLEDLAPARCGDQVAGCTLAQAKLAVGELAKFHATWWEDPRLSGLAWSPLINDPSIQQAVSFTYGAGWAPFLESYGHLIPPPVAAVGERVGRHFSQVLDHLSAPPLTVYHGDYRLDNMFFATAEGGAPLAVVDWQVTGRGRGSFDLSYFIAGTFPPAERRAAERDLLELYHTTLLERGVDGYSADQLLYDYRVGMLYLWVYTVIILGTLDTATERGQTLFTSLLGQSVAAVEDWSVEELIPA